jgi:hypothetical protein
MSYERDDPARPERPPGARFFLDQGNRSHIPV